MCNRRALFLCIILTGNYVVAMDVTSPNLSQSTMWTVQSIQASDILHQFGVSHTPAQWHLLNVDTVQDMFKNVEQKVGNSSLPDRLQLSCLVAHDLKKLPSDEEKKQKNIFTKFLKMCLPSQMLRDLTRSDLEKIEATKKIMLMKYVADSLNHENAENFLPLDVRKFIPRLDLLIKNDGVNPAQNQKVLNAVRNNRSKSQASTQPSADIIALASTVLSHAPEASAESSTAFDLPIFNPTDSVFLPQDVQIAANNLIHLKVHQENIEKEIATVKEVFSAWNITLNSPEISSTTFVRSHLEELLQKKINERDQLQNQLVAYMNAQMEVQQKVSAVDETLTSRQKERDDALSQVNEHIRIATSKLTQTEQFLAHAQTLKVNQNLELQRLYDQREGITKAQQRLAPGLQAVAEFKSMNQ